MSKAKVIKGLLSLFKQKTSKNKAKRIIESEMPGDEFFGKQPVAADPTAAKFKKLPETLEAEAEARKAILKLKQLGFMDETGGITEKALNPRGKAVNKLDDILERNKNDDPFKSLDEFYKKETGVDYVDDAPKTLEDTFKNVPPERRAMMEEMYAPIIEEQKIIEATQKEIQQTAAKIQDLIEQGRVDEAEALAESLKDFQTQLTSGNAMDATIIPPKRTLNAKGGRIGFAGGGLAGLYRFLTGAGKAGKAAKTADEKQLKEITDLLDQQKNEFNEFKMIYNEDRIAKGQPPIKTGSKENDELFKDFKELEESGLGEQIKTDMNEILTTQEQLIDEGYEMTKEVDDIMNERFFSDVSDTDPDRTLNAQGGRIGFEDGSDFKGGPKIGRRAFLGGLGAGIASLFMPRGATKVATTAAKAAPEIAAKGMPNWFPMLVNKIKTQGKQTEVATGGRNPENIYKLNDRKGANEYTLIEDATTGNIQVFSMKGDDYQQVNFEYIPPTEIQRPGGKVRKEDAEFYAGEFMKGHEGLGDVEQIGTIDELRFGINSIEEFAKAGNKTPAERLDDIAAEFKKNTTKEEFATGGRVGYNNGGGVGTLFRRKGHNG